MTEIYVTENENVYGKLTNLLSRRISGGITILKTPEGKPYIGGNELYFSISHSLDTALIIISEYPVGIDLELNATRIPPAVHSRFTYREREAICGNALKFYENWTAKEAFIKMRGSTITRDLKRTEYFGGKIYYEGKEQPCAIVTKPFKSGIYAICAGQPQNGGTAYGLQKELTSLTMQEIK